MKKAIDILSCIVLFLHLMLVAMMALGMRAEFVQWRVWTLVGLGVFAVSWLAMRTLSRARES